jgi:hypothetical protein
MDAGTGIDAGGAMCSVMTMGACDTTAESCYCCPIGGIAQHCTCSTPCTSDTDCTDPARPSCHIDPSRGTGFCEAVAFTCCWLCD